MPITFCSAYFAIMHNIFSTSLTVSLDTNLAQLVEKNSCINHTTEVVVLWTEDLAYAVIIHRATPSQPARARHSTSVRPYDVNTVDAIVQWTTKLV